MVKIVTDTTATLRPEVAKRFQIPVIPQFINFGEDSYAEGIDMDIDTFMQRLESSAELPKTAAPPPELFVKQFQRLVPENDVIICIHPSSIVSGTVRSASVAALDFPEADIRVIDTRLIASPLGTLVELAAIWADSGIDADTIEARIRDLMPRCQIYFLVATLEYLAKGGRIGGASALLGSVLQVKPILALQDGRVELSEKERTMRRAKKRLKDLVTGHYPQEGNGYLSIMHAGVEDQAKDLAKELCHLLNIPKIPIHHVPPAIITHAGPGVLGVGFFESER
jgi:DegV family protein with EDD domain